MSLTDPGFFLTYNVIQLLVFLVLIRSLDLYEREPLSVVTLMTIWGGTIAVAIGLSGNQFLAEKLFADNVGVEVGRTLSAPVVEEAAKALALIAAYFLSRLAATFFGVFELDGVTDGIVYGAAVGLGFAFTENALLFVRSLEQAAPIDEALGVFSARAGFLGLDMLGHAVYTGTLGAALGLSTWSRSRLGFFGYPVLGFALAVLMHAVYNGLGQLVLIARFGVEEIRGYFQAKSLLTHDQIVVGFPGIHAAEHDAAAITQALDKVLLVAFFVGIALWAWHQRKIIDEELSEETERGFVSRETADIVPRVWRRTRQYLELLRQGRVEQYHFLSGLHTALVDLALTKRRTKRRGAAWTPGVERLRHRVAVLSRAAAAEP